MTLSMQKSSNIKSSNVENSNYKETIHANLPFQKQLTGDY